MLGSARNWRERAFVAIHRHGSEQIQRMALTTCISSVYSRRRSLEHGSRCACCTADRDGLLLQPVIFDQCAQRMLDVVDADLGSLCIETGRMRLTGV